MRIPMWVRWHSISLRRPRTRVCKHQYATVCCFISSLMAKCNHVSDEHILFTWWRHQMETFFALLAFSAGNSPVAGLFPTQRAMTRSFVVFFDLRLSKRLGKQSQRRWFGTSLRSLWLRCSCNDIMNTNNLGSVATPRMDKTKPDFPERTVNVNIRHIHAVTIRAWLS